MATPKYHYNAATGEVGLCKATLRACPLGDTAHFTDLQEAVQYATRKALEQEREAELDAYFESRVTVLEEVMDNADNEVILQALVEREGPPPPAALNDPIKRAEITYAIADMKKGRLAQDFLSHHFPKAIATLTQEIADVEAIESQYEPDFEYPSTRDRVIAFIIEGRRSYQDFLEEFDADERQNAYNELRPIIKQRYKTVPLELIETARGMGLAWD